MVKIKRKTKENSRKKPKSIKKSMKSKKKVDYASLSVDNFFEKDFENESDSDENESGGLEPVQAENEQHVELDLEDKVQSGSEDEVKSNSEEDEIKSDLEEEPELVAGDEVESHKQALSKLKDTDPEFYQFLQENDKKLLQFNLSDDSSDEGDEKDGEEVHKPSEDLDVASDESDFEADDNKRPGGAITLKMLKNWESNVQKDKTNKTIMDLTHAFHAALLTVTSEEDQQPSIYTVEGSAAFNGVIQLCVLQLGPALRRFLNIAEDSRQPPHKCKKFSKIKRILKDYFSDLSKLLNGVSSPNIQTVLLKHLHYISPFLISYPNISKSIVKRLITIWGTGDEGVRVLAFFCILRITNAQRVKFLDTVLKSMYMTYVKNSKFVSLSSMASLNFMRRSLVEMFALDVNVSYEHVFLYIRQLAIHLRNAITVNKKENIQAVYNWQYVNSLKLWGNLLGATCNKPQLQQLVYPFVQVCLGTIKLAPTTQYFPLRFHLVQILIDFSRDADVFIPVLPFILEVLTTYDFNKKHQKVSMKPLNFTCLLRASKSQIVENGFKDAIIETIYGQLLEYLSIYSHTISFPDLSLICILQIKQFLKKCTNASYNRKMKQILEKIEQNNEFIERERSKISASITEFKKIEGFESQIKNKGTPIAVFFENWNKVHTLKKNKQMTNNEELGDYKLPEIKKKRVGKKREEGPVELFPSDSEDEAELGIEKKKKRGKRAGKNVKTKVKGESGPVEDDGEKDIVQDLDESDW